MPPVLALLANRPQLLLDHAQAYIALFQEELGLARASWQKQLFWQVVALCSLGTAVVLGGVALMLWAVTPMLQTHVAWVLFAVPLLPLAITALCMRLASQQNQRAAFANLMAQIDADLSMCRAQTPP
jgi:lysylphosphatidylglycerol synthetase-like protein (DUF2156 family)